MNQFKYASYNSEFASIKQVIRHMIEIESEAADSDLRYIIPFNYTYRVITQNVSLKLGTGYFEDDRLMETFDIVFARYYFDALKKYVDTGTTTPAWQVLFNNARHGRFSNLSYMALGVNAHVNNDLALALQDVISGHHYETEYNRINPLIYTSLEEVISGLNETKYIPKHLYKNSKIIYYPLLKSIIFRWRAQAWDNFLSLKKDQTYPDSISKKAYITGLGLSRIIP